VTTLHADELVIEGGPRPSLTSALTELWRYRGVLVAFAERDVRLKYKQAALGLGWAVIQPLAFVGILSLTIGRIRAASSVGVPYAAFALSTFVPWTFVQTAITFGANSLVTDANLVRRIYFPKEARVLGSFLAAFLDLVIGLGLFVLLGPILGAHASWTWIFALPLCVGLGVLGAGVGLMLAALNVYYRDFRHALPFLLQVWLFASPVAYPISVIPRGIRGIYFILNPAAGWLDGLRRSLTLGKMPDAAYVGASLAGTILVALIGYRIFKGLEVNFNEVV
jgi:homopolymeric O-antigen transport system permease protein